MWNRLKPINPTRAEFDAIYQDYIDVGDRPPPEGRPNDVKALITAAGFTVAQRHYPHDLHYSAQQWVDLVFTYSNHLTLAAEKASELRARLVERIGSAGVSVGGDALAILATPT